MPRLIGLAGAAAGITLSVPVALASQAAGGLAQERVEFATWLATAPFSPYAAIALQPVGTGISLGTEPADIPLPGIGRVQIIEEASGLVLLRGGERQQLPRGRAVPLGPFRLVAEGERSRRLVMAYGATRGVKPPTYYPANPQVRFTVELTAPSRRGSFRTLGLDGVETRAEEVGFVSVPVGPRAAPLRVYRMDALDDDEAELLVFFRDSTNAAGTYPAGRFVALEPAGAGKYVLDFNRARNPFCAYSSVFPCPAPWPGNTLPIAIEAGERYVTAP